MTEIAAPLVADLRPEVARPVPTLVVPSTDAPRRATRPRVAPLVHLLAATAAMAVAWPAGVQPPLAVGAALLLAWPLLLAAFSCFALRPLAGLADRVRPVLRAGGLLGLACWAGSAVGAPLAAAEMVPAVAAVVVASGLVTGGTALLAPRSVRLVVAGSPVDVQRTLAELARAPQQFDVVATWFSSDGEGPVSSAEDPTAVAAAQGADAVLVVPGPDLEPADIRRLAWAAAARDLHVYVSTGLIDVAPSRTTTVRAGGLGVLHLRPSASRGAGRAVKALLERVTAAVALLVLLPALVVVGVLVRRDTPGPALFRQRRVGKDGREFTMLKFRTMGCDAERELVALADLNESDAVLFKVRSDPRITRVGSVLRKYSVDELPQLWNVLRGQMSLVGPRPALPCEVAQYGDDPRRRLAVKPGLTGLWQVSGRSDLSWEESVRLDLQYVDNWSLPLDISILGRTVRAVVGHRGAY